jgi:hypothetical protein
MKFKPTIWFIIILLNYLLFIFTANLMLGFYNMFTDSWILYFINAINALVLMLLGFVIVKYNHSTTNIKEPVIHAIILTIIIIYLSKGVLFSGYHFILLIPLGLIITTIINQKH